MHGKTTLVRTYYELNVLLCLSMHDKATVVRTYYEYNVLLCVYMRGKTTVVCTMSGMCCYVYV